MDSPLMAATTQRGDEPGNGTIAAMLAQKNVHDRLYSGPGQQKLRVKDARQQKEEAKAEKRLGAATEACLRLHREGVEQKKEVLQKAQEKKDEEFREDHPFRPTFPKTPLFKAEKISGSRKEAWQRLQQSNSQKALALDKSRDEKEKEFTEDHPFKPTLVDAKNLKFAPKMPPRTTQEEWIQMQKDWQRKKVEKRTEKLREKLEEEINYLQEHAVHRNAQEVDAAAACKRLHQQHARQQERQHKRRLEHIADAHEDLNRIHRKLDKTPVASTKVVEMVERLYSHDLETRNERQQQRMKQKRKAEQAEQLLLDALSVHTPPAGGAPHSYHHDEVSLRIAKELAQLREQVSELHHRAMRTDYQDLVKKQTAPKAKTRPRSKEAPRSVSPSYAAQHAKRQGGPVAVATRPLVQRQGSASPTTRPLQPQGRIPSPSTPRSKASPKATSSRPPAKDVPKVSESPRRKVGGSSPRPKKSTTSPSRTVLEDLQERDPKVSPKKASRSTTESSPMSKSFADQVRAANSDGKTNSSHSESGGNSPREAPRKRSSNASSDASSRSRGKQLTPRRLRPASVSSASDVEIPRHDSSPEAVEDEKARAAAATKIQSRVRGKQARQEVDKRRQLFAKSRSETKSLDVAEADGDAEEQEAAAIKIQSCVRGKHARQEAQRRRNRNPEPQEPQETETSDAQADDDADDKEIKEEEVAAAIKIQSRVRGKQARQEAQERRLKRAETRSLGSDDEKELAATKIQSRFRGNQARKTVRKMQDEPTQADADRDEGSSSRKNDSSQSSENEGEEN